MNEQVLLLLPQTGPPTSSSHNLAVQQGIAETVWVAFTSVLLCVLQVHSVGDKRAEAQALVAEAVADKLSPKASPCAVLPQMLVAA